MIAQLNRAIIIVVRWRKLVDSRQPRVKVFNETLDARSIKAPLTDIGLMVLLLANLPFHITFASLVLRSRVM